MVVWHAGTEEGTHPPSQNLFSVFLRRIKWDLFWGGVEINLGDEFPNFESNHYVLNMTV